MRAPVSWLREIVAIPAGVGGREIADRLVRAGLEVESVERIGEGVEGTVVLGRVERIEELTEFKKPIRWCQVDVGPAHGGVRGIICGARNFAEGDTVVVALPGTVLPGGFLIAARETYGHTSDGMICSERELGLGDDHGGIMVLPAEAGDPGDQAGDVIGIGDEVLDIAVTPDRGYALSMRGLARELAIAFDVPFDDPALRLPELSIPDAGDEPVPCASEDLQACDLITLRTIVGFDPKAPAPHWMQRRLVMCGMRPVSLAVDVTNYVMLELGQPLHAFDAAKLRGTVRAARAGTGVTLETLDHVDRRLDPTDLVIRDDRGPLALAGVMGGLESEIDDATTSVALEAAHFSASVVAAGSRRHRLSSEASRRFERGVDPMIAPFASARAAALLIEFGGGRHVGMTAVEQPHPSTVIEMDAAEPGRVAGMPIEAATVVRLLAAVGCDVQGDEHLIVTAPTWRPDLADPADLVEEVLRLIGYDEIPATLPTSALGHGRTVAQRMRRRIGMALAARGAVEVLNYPFVGHAEHDALRLATDDPRRSRIRLANPLSDEQPYLRGTLLPGLLAAARRNIGRGADDLMLFEIGTAFLGEVGPQAVRPSVGRRPDDAEIVRLDAMLPDQPQRVAAVLTGERTPAGWWGGARSAEWSDAIELARISGEACGVGLTVERGDDPAFHPGRCARLILDGEVIGVAGELHPRVIEALELPVRTCAMELDLTALVAAAVDVRPAPDFSVHPVAKEDIALVVADGIPAQAVEQALREGAGPLLESVRLFDVYRGSQVPEGHRSLAFALRFRAPDRTLEAAETAAARAAALESAAARCGAVQR